MKTALITGGAQGIGAAAARRLIADGYQGLFLLDRNVEGLAMTKASLQFSDVTISTMAADLQDPATPSLAMSRFMSEYGKIDLLLNAAGSTERCGLDDTKPDAFMRIFDVNTKAPFFLMQLAAAEMRKAGGGVMINISSMLAHGGPPNLTTYSASKAALNLITRSAANTWKREAIRVFAINLGWTLTPGEHETQTGYHQLPSDWAEQIGIRMPFGRLGNAEDIAGVISFLASPAAAMMTGAIIDHEQMPVGVFDQHPALSPQ